ncbi:MAG: type II toxin-antitoxin system VapC family toxin [Candidatus Helarchaeota archaeon]
MDKLEILIDTSSLFKIFTIQKAEIFKKIIFSIIDLTFFEVGNVIWKHVSILHRIDANEGKNLYKLITNLLFNQNRLKIEEFLDEILEFSIKNHINFYDATYIVSAKNFEKILLTEDKKLKKAAEKFVNTISLIKLIEMIE